MAAFRVVTINILIDLSRWQQRRALLAKQLAALQPDLVALQEVNIPEENASWLAEQLTQLIPGARYAVSLCPKTGPESRVEAIAVLSRLPVEKEDWLDLGSQNRVAQLVRFQSGGNSVGLVNCHLFWQPGESGERTRQVQRIQQWLEDRPSQMPLLICGDFNATPETRAIAELQAHYNSAYALAHGQEPEYTCPTPLPRSWKAGLRTLLGFFLYLRPGHLNPNWRGTLDYIFLNPRLRVLDCQVVLNQPAQQDPRLYPSDHFGLSATLEIVD